MKKPMTPAEMGRKGGSSRSDAKIRAARRNAMRSVILRQLRKEAAQKNTSK